MRVGPTNPVREAMSDLSRRLGTPLTHELVGHAGGQPLEDRMKPLLDRRSRDEHDRLTVYQDSQPSSLLDPEPFPYRGGYDHSPLGSHLNNISVTHAQSVTLQVRVCKAAFPDSRSPEIRREAFGEDDQGIRPSLLVSAQVGVALGHILSQQVIPDPHYGPSQRFPELRLEGPTQLDHAVVRRPVLELSDGRSKYLDRLACNGSLSHIPTHRPRVTQKNRQVPMATRLGRGCCGTSERQRRRSGIEPARGRRRRRRVRWLRAWRIRRSLVRRRRTGIEPARPG